MSKELLDAFDECIKQAYAENMAKLPEYERSPNLKDYPHAKQITDILCYHEHDDMKCTAAKDHGLTLSITLLWRTVKGMLKLSTVQTVKQKGM